MLQLMSLIKRSFIQISIIHDNNSLKIVGMQKIRNFVSMIGLDFTQTSITDHESICKTYSKGAVIRKGATVT